MGGRKPGALAGFVEKFVQTSTQWFALAARETRDRVGEVDGRGRCAGGGLGRRV